MCGRCADLPWRPGKAARATPVPPGACHSEEVLSGAADANLTGRLALSIGERRRLRWAAPVGGPFTPPAPVDRPFGKCGTEAGGASADHPGLFDRTVD